MVEKYGVFHENVANGEIEVACEQLSLLGFTTISSGYSDEFLSEIRDECLDLAKKYQEIYGVDFLEKKSELNNYRAPLLMNRKFLTIARNRNVLQLVNSLIVGRVFLNQQNLVINPPFGAKYSQLRFHRDLPYQHYVSSRPLAINALLAIDDFTIENGATVVVPATHKTENFPSRQVIEKVSQQIPVKAGTFLVLDCMTYHAAAPNKSQENRIGLNHVYSTLMLKPQIEWSRAFSQESQSSFSDEEKEFLALDYFTSRDVKEFLDMRQ
jgi:ectoine hydroxylase-related dioxygenase (phytanoyl-CoA dioxygenase family)